MREYKEIDKGLMSLLLEMRDKVESYNDVLRFTNDEQAALKEIHRATTEATTGRAIDLSVGCSSCFRDGMKHLRNYLNIYDFRPVVPERKPLERVKLPVYEIINGEIESINLTVDLTPKTVKEYREALKHIGVPLPRNATKAQLQELWNQNN